MPERRFSNRAEALAALIEACKARARDGEHPVEAFDRLLLTDGAGYGRWGMIIRVIDRTFAEMRQMVIDQADVPQIKLAHGRVRHFKRGRGRALPEVTHEGHCRQEMSQVLTETDAANSSRTHRSNGGSNHGPH